MVKNLSRPNLIWSPVSMTMEAEREGEEQRRPLLSSSSLPGTAGHSSSSAQRGGGGGWAGGGPEVSAAEVKSAPPFSSSNCYPPSLEPHHDVVYPPSIHSAVVSPSPSPAPTPPDTHGLAVGPQGPYPYGGDYQPSQVVRRDVLDEVEIRNLLLDHVDNQCCWGSRPARTWKITSIEDCIVYVGTLETFIEERDAIIKKEPYYGRIIDGRDHGPVLGVWELDLRSEFPLLFVEKEVRVKIPHSEVTDKCSDCEGRRKIPCPTCNAGQQHGFYKANQMTQCSACNGRGLLDCQDGSDESDTEWYPV
ncbi:unnamed protein product [Alopecurus aequalis]